MRIEAHFSYILIIVALLTALLLEKRCNSPAPNNKGGIITSVTHTEYRDTGTYHVRPIYIRSTDTIYTNDTVRVKEHEDNAYILHKYLMKVAYNREFKDSNLNVSWSDTIGRNTLLGSSAVSYKWIRPVTVVSNTIQPTKARNKVFGGIGVGYEDKFKVELSALLLTKKENAYAIHNNPFATQPNGVITFYRKIKLRK